MSSSRLQSGTVGAEWPRPSLMGVRREGGRRALGTGGVMSGTPLVYHSVTRQGCLSSKDHVFWFTDPDIQVQDPNGPISLAHGKNIHSDRNLCQPGRMLITGAHEDDSDRAQAPMSPTAGLATGSGRNTEQDLYTSASGVTFQSTTGMKEITRCERLVFPLHTQSTRVCDGRAVPKE